MIDARQLALVIIGLTAVSAANRSFFFLSRRELPIPSALERGLRYAPVGALIAVVAPEILLVDGQLIASPWNAHLLSALAASGYAALRKRDMLGTILFGMAVYLTLHLAWGW